MNKLYFVSKDNKLHSIFNNETHANIYLNTMSQKNNGVFTCEEIKYPPSMFKIISITATKLKSETAFDFSISVRDVDGEFFNTKVSKYNVDEVSGVTTIEATRKLRNNFTRRHVFFKEYISDIFTLLECHGAFYDNEDNRKVLDFKIDELFSVM